VLRYLPTALQVAEISAELFISVNTTRTHIKSIYRKLDVPRRSRAVEARPGVATAQVHPVETTLHGEVRDRVALHTLLDKIDALGLEVVELRRTAHLMTSLRRCRRWQPRMIRLTSGSASCRRRFTELT
jgi:Bacterial regulatory proteins, luxR family